jgi:F-type H+-transporting ATPase subunit gamma
MSQTQLRRRAVLLDELRQIMAAMRNMSVTALQRLGKAAEVELEAKHLVLQALADMGAVLPPLSGTEVCLAIGSERGFCGGFNHHIAEYVNSYRAQHPAARCYVAGSRLVSLFDVDTNSFVSLNGCADMEEAADTVSDWLSVLLPDTQQPDKQPASDAQTFTPITVIYQSETGVNAHSLLPLPPLPPTSAGIQPWRYLSDATLNAGLISEWLRLALFSALTQSLTLEHRWRLNQMQQADRYLEETGETLRSTMQRQRQNQITVELENLMSALSVT